MSLQALLSTGFETTIFPRSICTIRNPREKGVLDAPEDVGYLCILVDKRFPDSGSLSILRPYTAKNLPGETPAVLFGWTDGNNVYDHFENNVHDDHNVVVAWKLLETPVDLRVVCGLVTA